MLFISRDDALYERVADDVAFAKLDNGDTFGVFQHTMRLEQA